MTRSAHFGFLIVSVLVFSTTGCAGHSKSSYADQPESVVMDHKDEFNRCYELAVQQRAPDEPKPVGRLEILYTISPSGMVTDVHVLTSASHNMKLEDCVLGTFKRLKFSSNPDGQLIQGSHAFDFKDQKG